MNWKSITSTLHEQVRSDGCGGCVLHDDGRGTWVPVRPFLERETLSLKDLRKWLWERRACRLLRRKGVALWAITQDGKTHCGFAVRIDKPVLDRWVRFGGPTI